jgi:dephospho-CoA kinase
MLKVGLTGSIAVGKSHVLSMLAELGCHVIDADQIAREVVKPGSEGLAAVTAYFGVAIQKADGELDREKLGSIVFGDEAKRKQLNSILHPLIIARQDEQVQAFERHDPQGVAVIDAALMIESGGYQRLDKLVVVHCDPDIQLQRLMKRDGLSRESAEKRINAQMPQAEKIKYGDYLIDTSGDFANTRAQVELLYERLKQIVPPAS